MSDIPDGGDDGQRLRDMNEALLVAAVRQQESAEQARTAEAALRASEERFRSFAEHSADTLWIVDVEMGRLDYLSPAFETMWGESRDRVMSDLGRWSELVHAEDRERAVAGMPRLLAGESFVQEYRITRVSDGAVRWIHDTGFPIRDESGRIARVGGVAQDVTSRKEADEAVRASRRRLRALVDGIPQLVWRAAYAGALTWSSPQWSSYTGLTREASRGSGWLAALHPDDRAGALQAWREAETVGRFEAEYRIFYAAEQRFCWFQTRASAVRDEEGAVVEWLGTSTDVDEQRASQERQKLLLAELQHRVRNTLSVVRSIARRTAQTSLTVEDYAMHLDGRLNAFARTQAAVTRDPTAGISLDFLVAEELAAYGAHEDRSGRTGRVRIGGPDIRLTPKAAETLGLAIHELATNAVKYGALSPASDDGRLAVTWTVDARGEPPCLHLTWIETGRSDGVPLAPSRSGFGTELLQRTLQFELKARTILDFRPAGLHCTIELPLGERVLWTEARARPRP